MALDINNIEEITSNPWEKLEVMVEDNREHDEVSYTYLQDAMHRLRKNKIAMLSIFIIVFMIAFAIFGPFFSPYEQTEQNLEFANIGIFLEAYTLDEKTTISLLRGSRIVEITPGGDLIRFVEPESVNMVKRQNQYVIGNQNITLDYNDGFVKLQNEEGVILESSGTVFNKTHWLGTDKLGRDMLVRLMYGARISLLIAFVTTVANVAIGVLYGGIAGYFGGWIDNLMTRIVDVITTIPLMLFIIILMVAIGPGLKTIIIALVAVGWTGIVRQVRGEVLRLKSQEYAMASKVIGVSDLAIIVRHLLPNAMGTIIVSATFMIPDAIFTEAFLSFIGLGIPAPAASWGTITENGIEGFRVFPYQLVSPSVFITVTILAFNILGDGLRDAFDPRLR